MIPFGTGVLRTGMYFDVPVAGISARLARFGCHPDAEYTRELRLCGDFPAAHHLLRAGTQHGAETLEVERTSHRQRRVGVRHDAHPVKGRLHHERSGDRSARRAQRARCQQHRRLGRQTSHLRDPNFIAETGKKNPSGNLTQGGDFEGWIRVEYGEVGPDGATPMTEAHAKALVSALRTAPETLPVNVNLATKEHLMIAGFSDVQAGRILEARGERLFMGEDDFTARARIQRGTLRNISSKITLGLGDTHGLHSMRGSARSPRSREHARAPALLPTTVAHRGRHAHGTGLLP